jgi:D-serine dehydratase
MLVKADHALPVAGSVKARGGIYEVLCAAERAAVERGLIGPGVSYESLAGGRARDVFGEYTIAVGSTGNLGLSVGIMGAALGFKTAVHMSAEAKAWKKDLLKKHGVLVVEHEGDYSAAVRSGREAASRDPRCHFVDDENSAELFLGYSVAALRMKEQLFSMRIPVDPEHPLFVYIPCGVGGAPGGITFGLKHVFGDAARCFFAEPVESPSMMLRLASGPADDLSVYDIGLENRTAADGLAVPKASRFAADMVRGLVDGCFTVSDNDMFRCVYLLEESTGLRVEPSAAAGFMGPLLLSGIDSAGVTALKEAVATGDSAHHAVWTTGGSFVPVEEFDRFREHGRRLCEK